jgi:S-adenosylmethionine:tRNA ribosyltransferase-isomerase
VKVSEFDYFLPRELVAQVPVEPRDASRLLVLCRRSGDIEHARFEDLPRYLDQGDCLVLNDTRVLRARLLGVKETGGAAEVFLLRKIDGDVWEALVRPGKRVKPGSVVEFGGLRALVVDRTGFGGRIVKLVADDGDVQGAIEQVGRVPLPPYIGTEIRDPERYQTVYASSTGSVAAPTAGLHFTEALLDRLRRAGVWTVFVTLHVGLGTFQPVKADEVESHRMHPEYFSITAEAAGTIERARTAGGRVIAVGTTSVRALESAADADGGLTAAAGWTSLFIYPGYRFRVVSALLTNFHLPRSTLLMLACAFGGTGNVLRAYREAVRLGYRFYSFGDAMLIR